MCMAGGWYSQPRLDAPSRQAHGKETSVSAGRQRATRDTLSGNTPYKLIMAWHCAHYEHALALAMKPHVQAPQTAEPAGAAQAWLHWQPRRSTGLG